MNIGGRGYLHRDVTIGNVLMLEKPVQRPAFSTRAGVLKLCTSPGDDDCGIAQGVADLDLGGEADDASSDDRFWRRLRDNLKDKYLMDVVSAAERLENALAALGVSTECMAIIIDGDMAADLQSYLADSGHEGVIYVSPHCSV